MVAHLEEKWGDNAPCPFCRQTSWVVDPVPVLWQRFQAPLGAGVPVFLVVCGTCGFEVPISVAIAGMWDELEEIVPEEIQLTPPSSAGEEEGGP